MIKRVRSIIAAVNDLDEAVRRYTAVLGVEPRIITFESEGVRAAMFPVGETEIELISPLRGGIPVDKFLRAKGEGLFGISLEVTDLEKDKQEMQKGGMAFLTEEPLIDEVMSRYYWSHPRSMNGVEFEITELADS